MAFTTASASINIPPSTDISASGEYGGLRSAKAPEGAGARAGEGMDGMLNPGAAKNEGEPRGTERPQPASTRMRRRCRSSQTGRIQTGLRRSAAGWYVGISGTP